MPESPLRVELSRTGGLAGVTVTAETGAENLPEEHAAQLRTLLSSEESLSESCSNFGAPDRFNYDLIVSDGDRQHRFTWPETKVPESIRPLLEYLSRLARPTTDRN